MSEASSPRPSAAAPTDLAQVPGTGGVVWSALPNGCHVNLVVLDEGAAIPPHRNDVVDVELVVLEGTGVATVDETVVPLTPMTGVLIPRGATRGIAAGDGGLRYLTIHAERPPLGIGTKTE